MTRTTKITCALVAIAAALAAAHTADAIEKKTRAGAACAPFDHKSDGWRNLDGALVNKSTSIGGDYICPLVNAWEGAVVDKVRVIVLDRHSSKNVYCHVYSRTASLHFSSWDGEGTSGFSTSPMWLTLDALRPGEGTSIVRCTVPQYHSSNGASGVVSYRAL